MHKIARRLTRTSLALGTIFVIAAPLAGCPGDGDSTAATAAAGSDCVGGVAGFFTRYAGTYTLPAEFTGVGSNNSASPTTAGVFTEGADYDIVVGTDQSITFPSDGGDVVFSYTDAANELAICERGEISGRTHEEYVRIDTADYSILFQAQEGADNTLGTADDEYQANYIILNSETGNIMSDFQDDEFWTFTSGVAAGSSSLVASAASPSTGDGSLTAGSVTAEIDGPLTRVSLTGADYKVKVYYTTATGVVTNVSYLWGNLATSPSDSADNIVFCSGTCGGTVNTVAGTITLANSILSDGATGAATLNGTITFSVP